MSTWTDRVIVDDPRIADTDPLVRTAAELLHRMESLHLHLDIGASVCVYCALRASHVLSTVRERLAAADSDGAAQAVCRALETNGAIASAETIAAIDTWRRLQDTALGERLRDQTAEAAWRGEWGEVDV